MLLPCAPQILVLDLLGHNLGMFFDFQMQKLTLKSLVKTALDMVTTRTAPRKPHSQVTKSPEFILVCLCS